MDQLEAHLTKKGTKFVNGDTPSIADFQLYAEFWDAQFLKVDTTKWAKITAWSEECRKFKGMKEVHDRLEATLPACH